MTRALRWARVALPATVVALGILLAGGGAPPAEAQQPPGSLDPTFGGDGKVITNISAAESGANAVVALDDGKILVAGNGGTGAEDFALARYTAAGTLDTTFGINGKVTTNFYGGIDTGLALDVQPDGKIVVAGYSHNHRNFDFALARYTAAGALDTTFGTGGKVTTAIGSRDDRIHAMAIQTDGKIVVAGYSHNGSDDDFALARYTADGTLDTAFGTGGKVTTAIGAGDDRINAMALLSDGKIVVAGYSHNGSNDDFALARYTADGTLDTAFGAGGKVTIAIGAGDDRVEGVVEQSGGKIVLAGYSHNATGTSSDFALARHNPDGTLDTDFGTGGKVTTSVGSTSRGLAADAQSDGKIVVAGYAGTSGNDGFALARYTAAGALDTTFGTVVSGNTRSGKVITAIGAGDDRGRALALQPDGKIVVAGSSHRGRNEDFALARYTAAGALDTTFGGGDSKVTTSVGTHHEHGYALALQPDGKIVVAGSTLNGATRIEDFALARHNSDGTPDTAFGTGGTVATDFGSSSDNLRAMALQSDGKIVVAGYSHNGSDYDFGLARYTAAGALDTDFGTGGKVTTNFYDNTDIGLALDVQPDGKIVVAGYSHNGSNNDFALARYSADGTLDTAFGTGGKVTTAIGSGHDRIHAMAIQTDGKIVVAGYSHNGSNDDFALARYSADGTLDTAFGTGGKVTTAIGSGHDRIHAMAIQTDGKIVVAGYSHNGRDDDFALARYSADGTLDTAFGTGGKVTTAIGSRHDYGYAILEQSDGKIVVAGASDGGWHREDFALARYTADGALDSAFGTGGKVTTPISANGNDRAYGAALQDDGKIVAAGYARTSQGYSFALARYLSQPADNSLSANANLSALTASAATGPTSTFNTVTLTPAFDADTAAYTATVPNTITHAKLTPTVADTGKATVQVGTTGNLNTVTSGTPSTAIALSTGANTITVRVTAESGATKTYTVTITRQSPLSDNNNLSALTASAATGPTSTFNTVTLTPAFDAATAAYTATVANTITHAKLTPTVADTGKATVQVGKTGNLADVTSGTPSTAIALSTGANTITVRVTAESGATKTYTVTITRQSPLSANNNLSALTASAATGPTSTFNTVTLTPAFDAATAAYTATVANTITHAKITPTVADTGKATVQVGKTGNLADVTSGSATTAIALAAGANTITVRVTAESGATKTYTVTITRQSPLSDNNNLSALTASAATGPTGTFNTVTLTPAFDAATAAYTATVANNITHAKITPTVADTGKATVAVGTTGNLNTVTSGTPSTAIALAAGANTITVRVTAENNATKTYTVTITRQSPLSANNNLSALTASAATGPTSTFNAITLTPAFDAATAAYTATVANTITHAKITPTVADTGKATVAVGTTGNLNTVTSGTPSTAIALAAGANTITVRVTAENNATKTYTVTITRQPPPPQQDPPGLPPIAARYDTNNDGTIDGTEYQQVKNDWLTAKITYDQFLEVVKIHLKSD